MTETETIDKNGLAYWFPKIEAAGLPVPETRIVPCDDVDLIELLDGLQPYMWREFIEVLRAAAAAIGYPCFLRTGHTSGKHEWAGTCYLTDADAVPQHVYNLVEYSFMVDLRGLPVNTWVVRRLIPTTPLFHAFRGMPIVREFRFFVRDGEIEHMQPYWPPAAFADTTPSESDWELRLARASEMSAEEYPTLSALAVAAGNAVGGYWSVDLLQDAQGKWWVTDMAEGERSYRWEPRCKTDGAESQSESEEQT